MEGRRSQRLTGASSLRFDHCVALPYLRLQLRAVEFVTCRGVDHVRWQTDDGIHTPYACVYGQKA
jgi:hypothetical protein